MGRLIVFLQLAAIVFGIAFFSVWGKLPAHLALLPLVVVGLVPCLCTAAVWPWRQVQLAINDGWGSNPFRRPAKSSIQVWMFLECIAPLAGIIGLLLFLASALVRGLTGNQVAVAGFCVAEATGVFLVFLAVRSTVESLARRERGPPHIELSPINLRRYSTSERESEVAQLLMTGLRYGEIGEKLFISVKTVKTHVHRLYEKTETRNRMELANMLRE